MLHLHGVHHRQRLATAHWVARLDGKGQQLAWHGGGQAASLRLRHRRMGQGIHHKHRRGAARHKHMGQFTLAVDLQALALAAQGDVQTAISLYGKCQRGATAVNIELQRTAALRTQQGQVRLTGKFQRKCTRGRRMRLPGVTSGPGVFPRAACLACSLLLAQGVGHQCRGRPWQAHIFLVEQRGGFAGNQRRVQTRLRKRFAGHHMAQKLHIGVQAHDVGCGQGCVQACQGLGPGAAVHDELGDHGVIKGADGVALAHARIHTHTVVGTLKAAVCGQGVHTQSAGGGQKLLVRRLGANARLDGVAGDLQLVLA